MKRKLCQGIMELFCWAMFLSYMPIIRCSTYKIIFPEQASGQRNVINKITDYTHFLLIKRGKEKFWRIFLLQMLRKFVCDYANECVLCEGLDVFSCPISFTWPAQVEIMIKREKNMLTILFSLIIFKSTILSFNFVHAYFSFSYAKLCIIQLFSRFMYWIPTIYICVMKLSFL